MKMHQIPFGITDWQQIERVEKSAQAGQAFWQTQQFGDIRVRKVEYTPGYVSDHWCVKGHILLCLAGELHTELARIFHQDSARRAQNRDGWVRDATNRGRVPSERSIAAPDARVWDAAGTESFCSAPVGFDTQQRSRADDNAQNDAPGEICGLADGRVFTLNAGMSYQVADNAEPHRSTSPLGATLFIVD